MTPERPHYQEPHLDGWFSKLLGIATFGIAGAFPSLITNPLNFTRDLFKGDIKKALATALNFIPELTNDGVKALQAPFEAGNAAVQAVTGGKGAIAHLFQNVTNANNKAIELTAPVVIQAVATFYTGGIYAAAGAAATATLTQINKMHLAKKQADLEAAAKAANDDLENLKKELAALQAAQAPPPKGSNDSVADLNNALIAATAPPSTVTASQGNSMTPLILAALAAWVLL